MFTPTVYKRIFMNFSVEYIHTAEHELYTYIHELSLKTIKYIHTAAHPIINSLGVF